MLATLKETFRSVKDLGYGKQIIKKTVGESFWYWLKYPLTLAILVLALAIAAVTYFSPQIPRLAEKYIPEGEFSVQDGIADTTIKQPFVWEDSGFAFIVNLKGQEEDLDAYDSGVLILEDRVLAKDQQEGLRIIKLSEVENFEIDKAMIVSGLEDNRLTILTVGVVCVAVLVMFGLGFYLIFETVVLLIWAVLFFVLSKVLKRGISYPDTLKIMYYSAVPVLLLNFITTLLPNDLLPLISMGIFVFLAASWIYRLPKVSK